MLTLKNDEVVSDLDSGLTRLPRLLVKSCNDKKSAILQ